MSNPWDNDPIVPGTGPSGAQPAAAQAAPAPLPVDATHGVIDRSGGATPWANDPIVPGTGPSAAAPAAPSTTSQVLSGAATNAGQNVEGVRRIAMHIGNALGLVTDDHLTAFENEFAAKEAAAKNAPAPTPAQAAGQAIANVAATTGVPNELTMLAAVPAGLAGAAGDALGPLLARAAPYVPAAAKKVVGGALTGVGLYAVKKALGDEAGEHVSHAVDKAQELLEH